MKNCACHNWASTKDQWIELYGRGTGIRLYELWRAGKASEYGIHHPQCTKRRIQ